MSLVASINGPVVFVLFLLTDAKTLGGTQGMLRRPKVPSDTNAKLPFPFPSHSYSQSPTCSHLLRKSLEKLMTCKSEVGDWLGGFCQPFKAGERTSHMVRNTRLLGFSLQVCFFCFVLLFRCLARRGFCKTEALVHRGGFFGAHSQWVVFGDDSVTMHFSADTFRQASDC